MISSLIKWFASRFRHPPTKLVPVNKVYVKEKGVWKKVWERKPLFPKKKWGYNPDCPDCGKRLITINAAKLRMFCSVCYTTYRCFEWPVPADYFKKQGTGRQNNAELSPEDHGR